jgi:hypothetical protein
MRIKKETEQIPFLGVSHMSCVIFAERLNVQIPQSMQVVRFYPNNSTMQTITHILTLPVSSDTLDFALICVAIVAVRVGLSIVLHKLSR